MPILAYPARLEVYFLVGEIINIHTSCMQEAKPLGSMYIYTDVTEQSLPTDAMGTDISCKLSDSITFSWRNQKTFSFGIWTVFPGILACIDEQNINLFLDMSNIFLFIILYQ